MLSQWHKLIFNFFLARNEIGKPFPQIAITLPYQCSCSHWIFCQTRAYFLYAHSLCSMHCNFFPLPNFSQFTAASYFIKQQQSSNARTFNCHFLKFILWHLSLISVFILVNADLTLVWQNKQELFDCDKW